MAPGPSSASTSPNQVKAVNTGTPSTNRLHVRRAGALSYQRRPRVEIQHADQGTTMRFAIIPQGYEKCRLADMFEQGAPFRGDIRQLTPCGGLGIAPSLAEEGRNPRLIESNTGPRAVSQGVVFARATL
jgi:hypothetical protein